MAGENLLLPVELGMSGDQIIGRTSDKAIQIIRTTAIPLLIRTPSLQGGTMDMILVLLYPLIRCLCVGSNGVI